MFSNKALAQLPEDFTNALSTGAGLVLSDFNPIEELDAETIKSNILFATDGGVNPTCVFTYGDHASGLDNAVANTKQLLYVTGVECGMSGTAKTVTKDSALALFAHADAEGEELIEITPRMAIKATDFKSYWFVAPYGTQGGFVAVHLKDALNTGGFSWQTANNEKGSFPFTFKGFSDAENPTEIPFKYYIKKASGATTQEVYPTAE